MWTLNNCLFPRKESFVYFSESHGDFTIALRVLYVENLHGKLVDNVSHESDVMSRSIWDMLSFLWPGGVG